jgi:tyrosyl-tRNA synthetase
MKFTTFPENINPFQKKGIVKFGIDPTGSEMHLGHLLPLRIVKRFKAEGFPIHIILGTFTAQIGDATGRDITRPILSREQTIQNASGLLNNVKRILGDDITISCNDEWLDKITMVELMSIISKFSVQKLLSRDNFHKRMETNTPIAMHELMGPILQGIDSFNVSANIEVGGSDQLFNFTISREIQEMFGQEPEICVMSPVINGLDGRKMSKSFGNCIFLNDKPEDVFGKTMSISDETMREWFSLFFEDGDFSIFYKEFLTKEFSKDTKEGEPNYILPTKEEFFIKHPMQQKKELAFKITSEIWSSEAAERALNHFQSVIQSKELPENMPEFPVGNFVEIVSKVINGSKTESRRLFQSGAVKVNGEKVSESFNLKSGDIIKVGKRHFGKIL